MSWKRLVIDIEANNLLMPLIDYSSMPFKLKKEARLWCISVRDVDTNQSVLLLPQEYMSIVAPTVIQEYSYFEEVTDEFNNTTKHKVVELREFLDEKGNVLEVEKSKAYDKTKEYLVTKTICVEGVGYNSIPKRTLTKDMLKRVLANCEELVGHNLVNYDLPALMLFNMLEYRIEYPGAGDHTVFGKPTQITDTLLLSKLYNPDRLDSFGKHGLAAFGKRIGNNKLDFNEFDRYSWQMGYYCDQDTSVGKGTLEYLNEEEDFNKDYKTAYSMEIKLIDLTVRQEAFGFDFDSELANKAITELEVILKEREDAVEPHLPPKSLNKGQQDYYTPPKIQFKKNGDPSASIFKFANKINEVTIPAGEDDKVLGTQSKYIITKPREGDESSNDYYLLFEGREYKLPCTTPVKESLPTSINDNNDVKGYLISLGWEPLEWVERDITKNSKKQKNSEDKVLASIKKYAAETENSPFKKHRYEFLKLSETQDLEKFLVDQYKKKPKNALKVITTPPYRTGAEKNLCQNLERLAKKLGTSSFIKSIVEWHTYAHRKNSIAGGTLDEDGEPTKGYLSFVREDGRVGTPADTVGAATYRYLHKGVEIAMP